MLRSISQNGHEVVRHRMRARRRPARKLGVVGTGTWTRKALWPALSLSGFRPVEVVVCSLEEASPLVGRPHLYLPIDWDGMLPVDELDARGFLGAETLWLILTTSRSHAWHGTTLAAVSDSVIGIEKPLAVDGAEARELAAWNGDDVSAASIVPIDHKLFTRSALGWVDRCRSRPDGLRAVRYLDGSFFETAGVPGGRAAGIDDALADCVIHLLSLIVAGLRAAGERFELTVERAWTASHGRDRLGRYAAPGVATAARVVGRIRRASGPDLHYDLAQCKGAPFGGKGLQLRGAKRELRTVVDLDESGPQVYARVVDSLAAGRAPRFAATDAVDVIELVDAARRLARHEPEPYALGSLPWFLKDTGGAHALACA